MMRRSRRTIYRLALVIAIASSVGFVRFTIGRAQTGGNLDLRRNVVSGGGGTSRGSGNKQVEGTVGQPGASQTIRGGTLTQTGGSSSDT